MKKLYAALVPAVFLSSLWLALFSFLPKGLEGHSGAEFVMLIRLPEAVAAIVTGAALAVSGLVFQVVLRNDLADPYVVGMSGGSAFGVTLSLLLLGASGSAFPLRAASSFAIGAASLFLLLRISSGSPEKLLLLGVLLNTAFAALARLLTMFLEPSATASVNSVLLGFISPMGREAAVMSVAAGALALAMIARHAREIDMLTFSDEEAKSLGVNIARVRRECLAAAALLAAIAVSVAGMVGFVGLIVPHLARALFGNGFGKLFAASLFLGPAVMLLAHFLTKAAPFQVIVPVGLYINFVGVVFFVVLFIRKEAGVGA